MSLAMEACVSAFHDCRNKRLETGGGDFLPKPFPPTKLLTCMQKHYRVEANNPPQAAVRLTLRRLV